MIEVTYRDARGAGAVLRAEVPTLADARAFVAAAPDGAVLRDLATGETHEAEPPIPADCPRGWIDLEEGILEDIASHQYEGETEAHIANLEWSWRECEKSNARCRKHRAKLRAVAGTVRHEHKCQVCGVDIVETIARAGGRPRTICNALECQRADALERKRASRERLAVTTTPPPVEVEGRGDCVGVEASTLFLAA